MKRRNDSKPGDDAQEDFGLKGKFREYHEHGGPQGDGRAKELDGDIGRIQAQHEPELKKARPDNSSIPRK